MGLLEIVIVVLLVLWALGFTVVHVGGGLIHLLIVVALLVFIYRQYKKSKAGI